MRKISVRKRRIYGARAVWTAFAAQTCRASAAGFGRGRGNRSKPSAVIHGRGGSMPAQHVLILGGARSGKTGFAERLAMRLGDRPLYLATAQALDAEMAERVRMHQQQRHGRFSTLEEPIALATALKSAAQD